MRSRGPGPSKLIDDVGLPSVEVKKVSDRDAARKTLSDNRQAGHNYLLMDRYEAGMALTGTEVKAAKDGKVQLKDA